MDVPTIVLIIGVSQYREGDIHALPGAKNDAILFARALNNWCIEPEITIFLDDLATNSAIDLYFENLEKRGESFKFVFYYSGHGMRIQDPFPSSYLMLHDSRNSEGTWHDALQLDALIEKIQQIKACETYLFIDACYLRWNIIVHPEKSFFCLLASGNQEASEDSKGNYGYFTQALLQSLSHHRTSNLSPVVIYGEIRRALEQNNLPAPEMYNIDTQEMGFLPSTLSSTLQDGIIHRPKLVAELQDSLVKLQSNILILTGEEGIGKTYFVQQLASSCRVFYLSLHPMGSHLEALDRAITEKFAAKIPDLETKPSYEESLACDSCFSSTALLIVDHLNFGDQESLVHFVSELSHLKIRFILVSKISLKSLLPSALEKKVHEWQMPPFTLEESGHLIAGAGHAESIKNLELVYLAALGNPKKILESMSLIFPTNFSKDDVNKTIAALYSVLAFIDEDLFCQVFQLNPATLAFFKEIGLISWQEDAWCAHDFVFQYARTERMSVDRITALRYWCQQFAQTEKDRRGAQRLIRTVLRHGYESDADTALQQAFFQLFQYGKESLPDLVEAAPLFFDREIITEAGLLLVDCLMDLGEFDVPRKLLALKPLSPHTDISVRLRKVHFFWRVGLFEESIAVASQLIEDTDQRSILALCYFHRGNAHFLSGNPTLAQENFSQVIACAKEPNLLGWSQCMQGTIVGQYDSDIPKATKLLRSGIHALDKCQDLRGVWLGWNNLGELSWKTKDYSTAKDYLENALELSNKLEIPSMQLESLRNLFHLTLRTEGSFSANMTHLFSQMKRFNLSDCENHEKVQLYNTLATVRLFRGEIYEATILLNRANELTMRQYHQCHIYTLGNFALRFKYYEQGEWSDAYLAQAIALARKYNHFLAIRQIQDDFAQFLKVCIESSAGRSSL